jgi:hypothetical protein
MSPRVPNHVLLFIGGASPQDSQNLRIRSGDRVPEANCWINTVDVSKGNTRYKLEGGEYTYDVIAMTLA